MVAFAEDLLLKLIYALTGVGGRFDRSRQGDQQPAGLSVPG